MKIKINIEADGAEVINSYINPEIQKQGITLKDGESEVKVQVFSEKKGEFIDYKPENVRFVFAR